MFGRNSGPDPDDVIEDDDLEYEEESSRLPEWLRRWLKRSGIYIIIGVLLLGFLALALSSRVFYQIKTGERGVRWALFGGGTVLDRDYPEGLRIISPWDVLYIYNVRVQEVADTVVVLSSNGLPMTVAYSVRYRPDLQKLPYLHQMYGPTYINTLLKPEIVSALREDAHADAEGDRRLVGHPRELPRADNAHDRESVRRHGRSSRVPNQP